MFNRLYRRAVDRLLIRRHHLTDYFFCIQPLDPSGRLQDIFSLASKFTVELETHPVDPEEYEFLAGGEDLPLDGRSSDCAPVHGTARG